MFYRKGVAYGISSIIKKYFSCMFYGVYGVRYEPYVFIIKSVERIKNIMIVSNMLSSRGNKVPNQFIIEFDRFTVFQSYNTLIAVYDHENDVMYQDKEKYSNTTSKYLNRFIREYQPLHISEIENKELYRIIERG